SFLSAGCLSMSASSTFSCTVFHGKMANDWNTIMILLVGSLTSLPLNVMLPDDGCSNPQIILMSVVFPHPLGPTRAMDSLFRTEKEMFCSATMSLPSTVYFLQTSLSVSP